MGHSWKMMILIVGVALSFQPVATFAQARSRYQWKAPNIGGIRTVGGDFSRYSSGMSGLKRPMSGVPGGILKSSLASNYNIKRSDGKTGALKTSLPKLSGLKGQTYGITKLTLHVTMDEPGRLKSTITGTGGVATTSNIRSKLSSKLGNTTTTTAASTTKPAKTKPITSFIPTEPSRYQKFMERGEQAFRAERYIEAADAFDVAIAMGRYLPESHLSLVHAYTALERYNSAAYQLIQTLKQFPELPMVSLRVRMFYGRTETFVAQMEKLRQEARQPYADADLSLLLAYFRYFDGDEADAAKMLRRAWDNTSKDNRMMAEAVETFWNGMVAAGKVKGSLVPTTKPAHSAPAEGRNTEKAEKKNAQEKKRDKK